MYHPQCETRFSAVNNEHGQIPSPCNKQHKPNQYQNSAHFNSFSRNCHPCEKSMMQIKRHIVPQ